jgi:hypothetical protein
LAASRIVVTDCPLPTAADRPIGRAAGTTGEGVAMPARSSEHVVGDKAVTAVTRVWQAVDAAVEPVKNDYGEDLLVQTTLHGEVDSSRVWVQVKGRTVVPQSSPRTGLRTLMVPWGHAIKWINSADVMVVVLWDVRQEIGWYTYPREQLNAFELVRSRKSRVAIRFRSEDVFDTRAAARIAWRGRIANTYAHFLAQRDAHDTAVRLKLYEDADAARKRSSYILWKFLCMVGIFAPDGLLEEFENMVRNACRNIAREHPTDSADKVFSMAILLAVLGSVNDVTDNGLDPILTQGLSAAVEKVIRVKYGGLPDWMH